MRRFATLVFLLFLAIPAGISVSGCYRNPAGNYCNGEGYGAKITDVYSITLQPQNAGLSLAYGQTQQASAPTAYTCKSTTASVSTYSYGTTNNQLVDISPTGNICAGTWNRNSGGGIADYTICNAPNPLPSTGGLPYAKAYISASAAGVSSNPVAVYVHAPVTSISLVGPSACLSQGQQAQLDAEACYSGGGNAQYELCAPSSVTKYSCKNGLAPGVTSVPSCSSSIGTLAYSAGTTAVANINPETNMITAELPGTTTISASLSNTGASAGYFSTCPPASISVSLSGGTTGTVTQGVTQSLVTKVVDTNGHTITGLTMDYQSTNPVNISVASSGSVQAAYPGSSSVYAICQPGTCNPAPINMLGVNGTGLPISSNAVDLTVPGTASSYVWLGAPGQSQYIVPIELLTGTIGSTIRLPYVPNSMMIDRSGQYVVFGSDHELMIFSTSSGSLSGQNPSVPGVVLAVSPTGTQVLVNDRSRQLFYIVSTTSSTAPTTFNGMGTAAQWTPDGKTLYVTDSAAAGPGHANTMYVYNDSTGWSQYPLTTSGGTVGPEKLAVTVPGVGAYLSGSPTVAHTYCPTGTAGNYSSMSFYPQGDSVNTDTQILSATTDGMHILGATATGSTSTPGPIAFSDIGVAINAGACPAAINGVLQPLTINHTLNQTTLNVNASAVNQIVTSPAAVNSGSNAAGYSLSFVTYNGTGAAGKLPYYKQTTGATSSLGTVNYLTLATSGSTAPNAPIAGAFSPDNTLFFVSTTGDNMIHYIDTVKLTDTQQISPNLPACTPGTDSGCTLTTPTSSPVPVTAIVVKPRATT